MAPEDGTYIIRSFSPDGTGDPYLNFYPDFNDFGKYVIDEDSGENGNFCYRAELKADKPCCIEVGVNTEAYGVPVVVERDPGYIYSSLYAHETGKIKLPLLFGGENNLGCGVTYVYFCPEESGTYVFESADDFGANFDAFSEILLFDYNSGEKVGENSSPDQSFRVEADLNKGTVYRLEVISFAPEEGTYCSLKITQDTKETGSILSQGDIWITVIIAAVVLGGVAALVIVKKKKKPALASGEKADEK